MGSNLASVSFSIFTTKISRMIPFSPPRIDDAVINEVTAALKSGWITTGPRTKTFEKEVSAYCGCTSTVAVNSWTMGMQVLLHW